MSSKLYVHGLGSSSSVCIIVVKNIFNYSFVAYAFHQGTKGRRVHAKFHTPVKAVERLSGGTPKQKQD